MPSPDRLSFVVFSDDWGVHPSSCQHLFGALSRDHDVLWVNTVGMRRPSLSRTDLAKAAAKLRRMWQGVEANVSGDSPTGSVDVVQPFQVPIPGSRLLEWANTRSALRSVTKRLEIRGLRDPIVVSTVPNAAGCMGMFRSTLRVYYCVDDFALWPGHERGILERMERDMVRRANLLVAPTPELANRPVFSGRKVHLLPHGVDLEHFSKRSNVAPSLTSLPTPRAGFFGLMDSRVDQELIAELARASPKWTFVFAGPTTVSFEAWDAIPNVHRIGPVDYRALPEVIAGLDVLLLPYRVNELTRSLAPLKLREYIASGKPIVACDIPAADAMSEWVAKATSAGEWARAIEASLLADVPARRHAARQALLSNSWAARKAEFIALCRAHLPEETA